MNPYEPQQQPEQNAQPKNPNPLNAIHTYQNDIAQTIKDKDMSVIDIALSEQQKKQPLTKVDVKKNVFLIPVILVLLFGTVIALLIIFLIQNRLNDTTTPLETKSRVISTESEILLPYTGQEPLSALIANGTASSTPRANSLVRYTFTDERGTSTKGKNIPIPIEDIVMAFPTMPGHLVRSLGADYIIGYHIQEANQEPFIILKTTSYDSALSGMLEWEGTLAADINTLFGRYSVLSEGISFEDKIIRNQNVRVGTYPSDIPTSGAQESIPFLYYALPNKDTIIITTHEDTLIEMLSRVATSQFVQ
jgi:hypothetical protein